MKIAGMPVISLFISADFFSRAFSHRALCLFVPLCFLRSRVSSLCADARLQMEFVC